MTKREYVLAGLCIGLILGSVTSWNAVAKVIYGRDHLEIVRLSDGTKCVIAHYPGGLSCDWSTP